MSLAHKRAWWWIAIGLLLPTAGCMLGSDFLSSTFLAQLGLDSAAMSGQNGVVIVVFNNTTRANATFYAFEADSSSAPGPQSRNFSVEVDPAQTRNEVLDCPVEAISPGILGANFSLTAFTRTAISVTEGGEGGTSTTVSYAGQPLVSGETYFCGDVVEIRLYQTEQGAYQMAVRIIPGG